MRDETSGFRSQPTDAARACEQGECFVTLMPKITRKVATLMGSVHVHLKKVGALWE